METLVELGNTKNLDILKALESAVSLNGRDIAVMGDSDQLCRTVLEDATKSVHDLLGLTIHGGNDSGDILG